MAATAPATFRLVVDPPRSGAANMALDLAALETAALQGLGTVRIYSFAPACLSLGKLQSDSDVDLDACRRDRVDVVRRPTGGRSILHDAEVTYSVACRADDVDFGGDVLTSCARIHAVVARALATLGVATAAMARSRDERAAGRERATIADCFARPASHELLDRDGHKLVGSAQARYRNALLQHGSILLEPPRAYGYFRGAAIPSAATRGVNRLANHQLGGDELRDTLAHAFRNHIGARAID